MGYYVAGAGTAGVAGGRTRVTVRGEVSSRQFGIGVTVGRAWWGGHALEICCCGAVPGRAVSRDNLVLPAGEIHTRIASANGG